jgi:hypothetical protein
MRKRHLHVTGIVVLALLLTACAAKKPVQGSANQFDSDTYLTLVTTDNLIQATKTALANNAFPASIAGNVKTALNGLIAAYNAANVAYQAYHNAALTGQSTPAQQAEVERSVANVQTATTNLTTVKGGK